MPTPSKRKRTAPPIVSKTGLRSVAKPVREPRRTRPNAKAAGKMNVSPRGRVLLAGKSRAQLRALAAGVAAELNSELIRIDLSQVVSKYIGETEKNLARLFDAAEASGASLLFDEADALFGKRTRVQSSHDRYANLEVSYLLQRIETYSGTVILTANSTKNLDEAFLRRLRFSSAPRPVPATRHLKRKKVRMD